MGKENDYLSVGRIVGVHGVNGNIKVFSNSGDSSDFKAGIHLLVRSASDQTHYCTVQWCKPHGRHFLLSFEEVNSRDQAEAIVGSQLLALRTDLPDLEDDTYYYDDIIGLAVYASDGTYIGHVKTIIPTGSNDVYVVVDGETGAECLVPALHSVIQEIDLAAGTMRVSLPDEL